MGTSKRIHETQNLAWPALDGDAFTAVKRMRMYDTPMILLCILKKRGTG
jgi:hypothetical protein